MAAVELRATLSEVQAEALQKRITQLAFKVAYQEEQHGAILVVRIGCTEAQEKTMREILREFGATDLRESGTD